MGESQNPWRKPTQRKHAKSTEKGAYPACAFKTRTLLLCSNRYSCKQMSSEASSFVEVTLAENVCTMLTCESTEEQVAYGQSSNCSFLALASFFSLTGFHNVALPTLTSPISFRFYTRKAIQI